MNIDLPPGVTLYGQPTPPDIFEVNYGDLWQDSTTGRTYRAAIGDRCPTCHRGRPTWEPYDLSRLERTDDATT